MINHVQTAGTLLARHLACIYRYPTARHLACSLAAGALLSACGGGSDGPGAAAEAGIFRSGSDGMTYRVALGTGRSDALSADERAYLWGLAGNDSLGAGSQGSNLYGDAGDDLLVGGAGADRLTGGKGNDRLYGGDFMDALRGGEGDDFLDEGKGHGDLDGGPGNDTLVGGAGPDAFAISPTSGHDVIKDFTAGPGMFDHLAVMQLHWADLTVEDTAAGVKVSWANGSVLLEGVKKADLAQDDFMFAESPELPPASRAPAAAAPERATPSTSGPAVGRDAMLARLEARFTFAGDENYHVRIGGSGADVFDATEAWDHYIGGDGNDKLSGGAGDDVLEGNAGDDTLTGGVGRDKLLGGMGNDTLSGGDGEDELQGGDGDDIMDAGAGHDMIEGGKGNDIITGGTGADAFIVSPDSGYDVVLDFEASGAAQGAFDHIALMDILPEQVSVTDTADGARVSWDTNGDGKAEGSVLLKGVPMADLRQSDFMFVPRPGFVAGISTVGSYFIYP